MTQNLALAEEKDHPLQGQFVNAFWLLYIAINYLSTP
jgi:hypothetical protein